MYILGIETSCDETSAAIVRFENDQFFVDSVQTFSQIETHAGFGGIIPEVAARLHVPKMLPLIQQAFDEAGISHEDLDGIAVTGGPGLVTSLIVGIHTARILSKIWEKPLINVNHMEGHVTSSLLSYPLSEIEFPALCLTVSGGHTELVHIPQWGEYSIIGRTRDDAVGEAFDKVAKTLGLSYPGGPAIAQLAESAANPYEFTAPMMHADNFDFSFSGLKTAVLYTVRELQEQSEKIDLETQKNIAAGFENAAVQVLVHKTKKAIVKHNIKSVFVGGGVAANKKLRTALQDMIASSPTDTKLFIPDFKYCTDNAAMIAVAGYFKLINSDFISPELIKADPVWEIGTQAEQ
jgi:N6-L-threonylcarbamoyladenine synthase